MCRFIAQLVEQCTGNAEVTGSNPVEALIFFFFNHSQFCRVTQRKGAVRDKTKLLDGPGDQFPTSSAGYCVVTKSASPQRS